MFLLPTYTKADFRPCLHAVAEALAKAPGQAGTLNMTFASAGNAFNMTLTAIQYFFGEAKWPIQGNEVSQFATSSN